jgi:hypothetical protein
MFVAWLLAAWVSAAGMPPEPKFPFAWPFKALPGSPNEEEAGIRQLRAQIPPEISAAEARRLVDGPACQKAQPRHPTDKFEAIGQHSREGICWCLEKISKGRPAKRRRFPEAISGLVDDPSTSAVLGPSAIPGGRMQVEVTDGALSLTQLDPATDYKAGERFIYWIVSRGDFTGDGEEDLLLWIASGSSTGTFAECSALVVDRKANNRLRWRARIGLGRCT